MATSHGDRVALMAIHPIHAQAILDGSKKVEFRKRPLAADVGTVVIYETSPTQRIIGEFTVDTTVTDTPGRVWRRFRHVAGISAGDYAAYFEGQDTAVALCVGSVRKYDRPLLLDELDPRPGTPQSFVYVNRQAVADAERQRRRETSIGLVSVS